MSENCPSEPHDLAYYSKVVPPDFNPSLTFAPLSLDLTDTVLSESQQKQLKHLISQYRDVFAANDTELGCMHIPASPTPQTSCAATQGKTIQDQPHRKKIY